MQLQPIVYVTDMERSIEWYENLLDAETVMESDHWTTFSVDGTTLALHLGDKLATEGMVGLSLVADEPLEQVAERVAHASEIIEQPFGRSFTVTDPDGTRIQVNEHS